MTTGSFPERRQFEAQRMPEVKQILSCQYPGATIQDAPEQLNEQYATDLLIQINGGKTLHCVVRVRTKKYTKYWPNATFRSSYPNGNRTEWDKIKDGAGDIMFYGIWDGKAISKYVIMSLDQVRKENQCGNIRYGGQNPPEQGGETFVEIVGDALKRVTLHAAW